MAAADLAEQHYQGQEGLVALVLAEILKVWALVDPLAVAASWAAQRLAERIYVLLSLGQAASVERGAGLVEAVAADYGIDPPQGVVDPMALAGLASDGRDLETLLLSPVVDTLAAQRAGVAPVEALARGAETLTTITETQVADAGRVATQVAITVTPGLTRWVRMLQLPSCARCAILAGRIYRWSQGFDRHPRCDCVHVPLAEDDGDDLRTDPMAYFRSLSKQDQDKYFTVGGAEAIRLGGDINQVVNVRRYASSVSKAADGVKVIPTGRGRRRGVRPMPESLIERAHGDRAEAVRLLTRAGYISA